jgi:hypothetical protein
VIAGYRKNGGRTPNASIWARSTSRPGPIDGSGMPWGTIQTWSGGRSTTDRRASRLYSLGVTTSRAALADRGRTARLKARLAGLKFSGCRRGWTSCTVSRPGTARTAGMIPPAWWTIATSLRRHW